MLFKNILDDKYREMLPVFNQLLNMSLKNQAHNADLLLVSENAGYYKEVEKADNLPFKPDPYTTGPQMEGHSEDTHHKFIGQYIKGVSEFTYDQYVKMVIYDPLRIKEIDELVGKESMSIQIEMLIYIKIWESDAFIKKLYQLARLINGEEYDWHFKIKGHDKTDAGGQARSVLIRDYIIKKFKSTLPLFYQFLSNSYKFQIRNAIAHSQYAIIGRAITFNNYIEANSNSISHLTFDAWTDLFHEALVLYTLYHELFIRVNDIYHDESQIYEGEVEIKINRLYPVEITHYRTLYTRPFFKDWSPYKENKE